MKQLLLGLYLLFIGILVKKTKKCRLLRLLGKKSMVKLAVSANPLKNRILSIHKKNCDKFEKLDI